jgi:6-pyruvoyltetrahydropterin/6-carboxytetrahydropterin synthase
MFRVTRRYPFSASHRLHSLQLSEEENRRVYGKCNNPYGHGHNYVLEVTVRGPLDPATGMAVDPRILDALVAREIVAPMDHRDLNSEIPEFAREVPTSENLGFVVCRRLKQAWKREFPGDWPCLDRIRIAETPRNIFEVKADEIE